MSTLSVPLPTHMASALEKLVKQGVVPNMAAAARLAIQRYLEDQAVEAVLKASREQNLKGDLDDLAKKL